VNSTGQLQILLYTQQPFVARGFAAVLHGRRDFHLVACCNSLPQTVNFMRAGAPDILLVHLTYRISLSDLQELRGAAGRSQIVLWGQGLSGEFAFQAMQLGVHGILQAHTPVEELLTALQSVHRGVLCFERELMDSVMQQRRITLTKRQGQIVSLVSQGFKNKEIAFALGITEGTVKVYLYKLFQKLGMNDRLDMALYGLKNLFAGEPQLGRIHEAGRRQRRVADPFGPRSLPPQVRERVRLHAVN
jgi:two-component system, NarL family, nitrate/nitrite response regulator NarL